MSYNTFRDSGDEQTERAWHFIGRAYVCYKGGFMHEHLSADDNSRCTGLDTERRLKREHERYLKDQELRIEEERTRRTQIEQAEQTRRIEMVEETKRLEITANRERQTAEEDLQRMRIEHALEIRRLETEHSANNMERSRVEELVNSFCDLLIRINQSTDLGSTLNEGSQMPQRPVRPDINEWIFN